MSAPTPRIKSALTLRGWTPALVATGTLALGYADLARGGSTISALLLVAGYVVAVPWAILRTAMPGTATRAR